MWAASSDRAPLTLALSLARGERAPSGAIRMTKLTFGYLYDFRNPAQWRRPWAELYADILDFAAHTEALGFDGAWVPAHPGADGKSGGEGKGGSVRVDLGGRRIIK